MTEKALIWLAGLILFINLVVSFGSYDLTNKNQEWFWVCVLKLEYLGLLVWVSSLFAFKFNLRGNC